VAETHVQITATSTELQEFVQALISEINQAEDQKRGAGLIR
jgi:hypothetical protein